MFYCVKAQNKKNVYFPFVCDSNRLTNCKMFSTISWTFSSWYYKVNFEVTDIIVGCPLLYMQYEHEYSVLKIIDYTVTNLDLSMSYSE